MVNAGEAWFSLLVWGGIQGPSQSTGKIIYTVFLMLSQPSECGRQHALISVHAQTAACQQSNGNSEAMMSEKCGEWRDYFIMTLSPIHWVPVQDKGSKILCGK